MPETVLTCTGLTKAYDERVAVDGVGFSVAAGATYGLLGPNGAGKTTSFYMIIGLVTCDSGSVHLNRRELTHFPMHVRARMGLGRLDSALR